MMDEEQNPKIETVFDTNKCQSIIADIVYALQSSPTKSRERSIAITKLEEAGMWLLQEQLKK